MSIGPFDPTAGDYGSLDYTDPFGDTTADIDKATVPAKVSGGNVGISPITMQDAVSIPAEEQSTDIVWTPELGMTQGQVDRLNNMSEEDTAAIASLGGVSTTSGVGPFSDGYETSYQDLMASFTVPDNVSEMSYDEIASLRDDALAQYQGSANEYGLINWEGAMHGAAVQAVFDPLLFGAKYKAGDYKTVTDRTGQYEFPDIGSFMMGSTADAAKLSQLNSDSPEPGGVEAARQEYLNYLSTENLGDGDVYGYNKNIQLARNAIYAKYGVLGSDEWKNPDFNLGGTTGSGEISERMRQEQIDELTSAFASNENAIDAIREYSGISDYVPANYAEGRPRKIAEHSGYHLTDEKYNEFYSLLKPLADEFDIQNNGLNFNKFYSDPLVASIVKEYGFNPYRSTKDGSQYVFDPRSNREVRTYEAKYSLSDDVFNAIKIAGIAVAGAALGGAIGGAIFGGGTGAGAGAAGGTAGAAGGTAGAGAGAGAGVAGSTVTVAATPSLVGSVSTALGKAAINTAISGAITEFTGGDFEFNAENFIASAVTSGLSEYSNSVRAAADTAYEALNTVGLPPVGAMESYATLNTQANILDAVSNTASAVNAIESGDYLGAFNSVFELSTSALSGFETSGVDVIATFKDSAMDYVSAFATDTFGTEGEWFGANVDDLTNGVMDYAQRVMNGDDPVDALGSALTEYAKNGGSLGVAGESARDFIEQAGGAFYDNVIKPVGDALANGYETVANLIPDNIDTPEGVKALEDAARTAGSNVEDAVREAGEVIDDNITQPVKEVVEEAYESIPNPEFAGDVDLPEVDVDLPEVDVPEVAVDLPDVDLPGIDLPSLGLNSSSGELVDSDFTGTNIPRIQQVEEAELFGYTDYLNKLLRG